MSDCMTTHHDVLSAARTRNLRLSTKTDLLGTDTTPPLVQWRLAESLAATALVRIEDVKKSNRHKRRVIVQKEDGTEDSAIIGGEFERWMVITEAGRQFLDSTEKMTPESRAEAMDKVKATAMVPVPKSLTEYERMANAPWLRLAQQLGLEQEKGESRNRFIDRVWEACVVFHRSQVKTVPVTPTPSVSEPTVAPTISEESVVKTTTKDDTTDVRIESTESWAKATTEERTHLASILTSHPSLLTETSELMVAGFSVADILSDYEAKDIHPVTVPVVEVKVTSPTVPTPSRGDDLVALMFHLSAAAARLNSLGHLTHEESGDVLLLLDSLGEEVDRYVPTSPTPVVEPVVVPCLPVSPPVQDKDVKVVVPPTPRFTKGQELEVVYMDSTHNGHLVGKRGKVVKVKVDDEGIQYLIRPADDRGDLWFYENEVELYVPKTKPVVNPKTPPVVNPIPTPTPPAPQVTTKGQPIAIRIPRTMEEVEAMNWGQWAKLVAFLDADQKKGESKNAWIDRVWAICQTRYVQS